MEENAAVVSVVCHGSFSLTVDIVTLFITITMRMQTRGNGSNRRSIMLHKYDTQSKGYTGAKCGQTYEISPCMPNNRMSCL